MRKCLLLLLLSTFQIFSEELIETFFTSGRNFQPTVNEFIKKAGKGFTSFPSLPDYLSENELFMRIRYGHANYRLYKGHFNRSRTKTAPVFHFNYVEGLSKEQCSRIRFYSAIDATADIPVVYFSKGGMHVEVASVLFYNQGGRWKKITAQNVDDAKALQIKTGTLAITSKPAGIPIYLDGKPTGLRTPNYLQNILVGNHRIRLVHDDYQTVEKEVSVVEDDYVALNCTLSVVKSRFVISGSPIGAEVKINGYSVGQIPLTLPDLAIGEYEISISHELHQSERYRYFFNASGNDTLSVSLKEQFGRLFLPVLDEGEWYVNHSKVIAGEQQLPAGSHHVQYRGLGRYETFDTLISIRNGELLRPQFHFSRPEGEIEILPMPLSAEVFVNGKSYGYGPQRITLPVGEYTILCKSSGHEMYQQEKSVSHGEYSVVKAMLREKRDAIATRVVERRSYRKVVTSPVKQVKRSPLSGTYAVFAVGGTSISRSQSTSITEQLRDNHDRQGATVLKASEMKRALLNRGFFAVTVFNKDEAIKYGKILKADFAVYGRVIRDSKSSEPYLITQTVDLKTYQVVARKSQKWSPKEKAPAQLAFYQ